MWRCLYRIVFIFTYDLAGMKSQQFPSGYVHTTAAAARISAALSGEQRLKINEPSGAAAGASRQSRAARAAAFHSREFASRILSDAQLRR